MQHAICISIFAMVVVRSMPYQSLSKSRTRTPKAQQQGIPKSKGLDSTIYSTWATKPNDFGLPAFHGLLDTRKTATIKIKETMSSCKSWFAQNYRTIRTPQAQEQGVPKSKGLDSTAESTRSPKTSVSVFTRAFHGCSRHEDGRHDENK